MNEWLKQTQNMMGLRDWWSILKRKLIVQYQYYGIRGNMPSLQSYYSQVLRLTYKWINRRSKKLSYTWEQYSRWIGNNPLPQPKIYHKPYKLITV